jgi:hypothetical protein
MKNKNDATICIKCDGLEFKHNVDSGAYKIHSLELICGKCVDPVLGTKLSCRAVNTDGNCEHYKLFEKWRERKPDRLSYASWCGTRSFWDNNENAPNIG